MINVNQMMNSTAILYAKIDANPVGTIELVDRCLHRCSSPVVFRVLRRHCIILGPLVYIWANQRTLSYFVRGSITVQLTSCLTGLDWAELVNILSIKLKQSSLNQSNRRSAVQ